MARYTDPFGDMDDIFNQLWGNNGLSSESSRYMINGHEVTPEEFEDNIVKQVACQIKLNNKLLKLNKLQCNNKLANKKVVFCKKLGRNLTQDAREGKLDPVIGRKKRSKKPLRS